MTKINFEKKLNHSIIINKLEVFVAYETTFFQRLKFLFHGKLKHDVSFGYKNQSGKLANYIKISL